VATIAILYDRVIVLNPLVAYLLLDSISVISYFWNILIES
jgi:hypothetical protein